MRNGFNRDVIRRLRHLQLTPFASLALVACVPNTPGPVTPNVVVSSSTYVGSDPSSDGAPPESNQGLGPPGATLAPPSILVVTERRLPRPTEIIGVLDFHSDAASEDKGFNELRQRAAGLGADAVIGAEFEHGAAGEPSHLSGLAVRFLDR